MIRSGRLTLADPEVVALSPDGRHIAVTSAQGEVLVLDTAAGAAPGRPVKVKRGANSLAFSADGSLLVAPGEGTVNLYDGSTVVLLGSVVVPNRTTVTADFRPDGHTVVIASYDDAIYTWDTRIEHTIDYACRTAGRDLPPRNGTRTSPAGPTARRVPDNTTTRQSRSATGQAIQPHVSHSTPSTARTATGHPDLTTPREATARIRPPQSSSGP